MLEQWYDEYFTTSGDEGDTLVPSSWSLENPSSSDTYIPSDWYAENPPEVVASSGGGLFDVMKSIVSTLSPIATSFLKAYKPTLNIPGFTQITKPTTTKTGTQTSSIAGLTSSPILLAGLGLGAYMFLRGRKKSSSKRRRRR